MTEPWILYAGIAVWLGLALYMTFLAFSQRALSQKLAALESDDDEDSRA